MLVPHPDSALCPHTAEDNDTHTHTPYGHMNTADPQEKKNNTLKAAGSANTVIQW